MLDVTGSEKPDQEDLTVCCLFYYGNYSEAGSSVEKSFVRTWELQ